MMSESTDNELLDIYENDLSPSVDIFGSDIVLVSVSYDLHESDSLTFLNITSNGTCEMVRDILDNKKVPIVRFLEGDHDVDALGGK